jgi:putative glycerol-1-phosphate prenyltransferase
MKFKKIVKQLTAGKEPLLAVLVDPDKFNPALIEFADRLGVHCGLVGGSRLEKGDVASTIARIKKISKIPVILFPGDESQLTHRADGLLLLSLLSGRNPEYLIEKHIAAAPVIKRMKLSYISTAYLLIDGGKQSTTQKVTGTRPLDPTDVRYIVHTAIAAEQLGFKAVYLEAGSGAPASISPRIVTALKKETSLPVIVGGGIHSRRIAESLLRAGADMLVIGNALEKNMLLLEDISKAFKRL